MKKFLIIFQTILTFSLIFLLCFIWARFLRLPLWATITISLSATLFLGLLFYIFSRKNKKKQSLKLSEKEDAENMFLSLLTDKNNLNFFLELVKSRHQNAIKKKNYILITHQDKSKVILMPFINLKPLSLDDIAKFSLICNTEKADKFVILCYDYDRQVLSFVKNFKTEILVLDRFDTYSRLYKEYDFYPEITIKYKKEVGLTFKELLAYSFNKSRSKGYLFAALILFITSFFVRLNIYYCITASILLLFAFISFINPKYNHVKTNEII